MAIICSLLDSAAAAAQAAGIPFFSAPGDCWQQPTDTHEMPPAQAAEERAGVNKALSLGDNEAAAKLAAGVVVTYKAVTTPGLVPTLVSMARVASPWQKAAAIGTMLTVGAGAIGAYVHSSKTVASHHDDDDGAGDAQPVVHTESPGAQRGNSATTAIEEATEPTPEPQAAGGAVHGGDDCDDMHFAPGELNGLIHELTQNLRAAHGGGVASVTASQAAQRVNELLDILRAAPQNAQTSLLQVRADAFDASTGQPLTASDLLRDFQALEQVDLESLEPCDIHLVVDYAMHSIGVAVSLSRSGANYVSD